jgi:hypothetical protein
MVQFGMRGAMAPAIGLCELVVLGHAGSKELDGVLHVPDLVVSLFSVRAAPARYGRALLPSHITAGLATWATTR